MTKPLLELLDELDRLEKKAMPAPWDGLGDNQSARNMDLILSLRNNWPRISKAFRAYDERVRADCICSESGQCGFHEKHGGGGGGGKLIGSATLKSDGTWEKTGLIKSVTETSEDAADIKAARKAMKEDTVSLEDLKKDIE